MDSFGPGNKRGRPGGAFNGYSGSKRSKQELESIPTATGSKSKPCTKFFRIFSVDVRRRYPARKSARPVDAGMWE